MADRQTDRQQHDANGQSYCVQYDQIKTLTQKININLPDSLLH